MPIPLLSPSSSIELPDASELSSLKSLVLRAGANGWWYEIIASAEILARVPEDYRSREGVIIALMDSPSSNTAGLNGMTYRETGPGKSNHWSGTVLVAEDRWLIEREDGRKYHLTVDSPQSGLEIRREEVVVPQEKVSLSLFSPASPKETGPAPKAFKPDRPPKPPRIHQPVAAGADSKTLDPTLPNSDPELLRRGQIVAFFHLGRRRHAPVPLPLLQHFFTQGEGACPAIKGTCTYSGKERTYTFDDGEGQFRLSFIRKGSSIREAQARILDVALDITLVERFGRRFVRYGFPLQGLVHELVHDGEGTPPRLVEITGGLLPLLVRPIDANKIWPGGEPFDPEGLGACMARHIVSLSFAQSAVAYWDEPRFLRTAFPLLAELVSRVDVGQSVLITLCPPNIQKDERRLSPREFAAMIALSVNTMQLLPEDVLREQLTRWGIPQKFIDECGIRIDVIRAGDIEVFEAIPPPVRRTPALGFLTKGGSSGFAAVDLFPPVAIAALAIDAGSYLYKKVAPWVNPFVEPVADGMSTAGQGLWRSARRTGWKVSDWAGHYSGTYDSLTTSVSGEVSLAHSLGSHTGMGLLTVGEALWDTHQHGGIFGVNFGKSIVGLAGYMGLERGILIGLTGLGANPLVGAVAASFMASGLMATGIELVQGYATGRLSEALAHAPKTFVTQGFVGGLLFMGATQWGQSLVKPFISKAMAYSLEHPILATAAGQALTRFAAGAVHSMSGLGFGKGVSKFTNEIGDYLTSNRNSAHTGR